VPGVLVIEDDVSTRDFLCDLFGVEGYSVVAAAEGAAGLEVLRTSQSRLVVIVDHRLPDMSGMDILRVVATNTHLRQTYAYVMVTADAHRFSASDQAIQQELHIPVIAKPFDIEVLLDAVAQAQLRLTDADETHMSR
jgi:CheY-like chemotaxis protein